MTPLRFGLIGCGPQGLHYKTFVKGEGSQPLGEIVAVADTGIEIQQQAADYFELSADHCYSDIEQLLEGETVDAVIVATPDDIREPVLTALHNGLHVFCENPLGSESLIQQAEQQAHRYGLVCTVNEQWRWLSTVLQMKEWVDEGLIGPIMRVVIGGKGRPAPTELMRIGTHLLSVAIHHFTGWPTTCSAMNITTPNGPGWQVTYLTESCPISMELWLGSVPDVRRCFIRVEGTTGRFLAIGGLLENLHTSFHPYDSAQAVGYQRHFSLAGLWEIMPGKEDMALLDPRMNPTFWLFDQFCRAIHGEVKNPYPPRDFLPITRAVEATSRSLCKKAQVPIEGMC